MFAFTVSMQFSKEISEREKVGGDKRRNCGAPAPHTHTKIKFSVDSGTSASPNLNLPSPHSYDTYVTLISCSNCTASLWSAKPNINCASTLSGGGLFEILCYGQRTR